MAARKFDRRKKSPIVKSSSKETPLNSADYTIQGLTDHAERTSMAAESNSSVGLSSRQLLSPAVDGFFVAQSPLTETDNDCAEAESISFDNTVRRTVVYVPPDSRTIHAFALAVCDLMKPVQTARASATEVMQGLSHFLNCVATLQANHLNRGGNHADEEIDLLAA